MKFSVITPSFNQATYLERTLRSVHDQHGDFTLEHFVVDGGSTDGSVEILRRWADKLKFASEKDRGQSHALNKGLALASGDVIVWVNSDDLLLPGALAIVADFWRARPGLRWAYGRALIIDEDDREIRRPITAYKNLLMRKWSYDLLLLENYLTQPAVFFTRELLAEAGRIDESLVFDMDYDLWLRFGRICRPQRIDADLAALRWIATCKTGGAFEQSLASANATSRKYSAQIGKPWLGAINYYWYAKRTALIYRLLARMQKKP